MTESALKSGEDTSDLFWKSIIKEPEFFCFFNPAAVDVILFS